MDLAWRERRGGNPELAAIAVDARARKEREGRAMAGGEGKCDCCGTSGKAEGQGEVTTPATTPSKATRLEVSENAARQEAQDQHSQHRRFMARSARFAAISLAISRLLD